MTRNGSYYIPRDKEEAKALESMECYGSRFIRIESDPVPDKNTKPKGLEEIGDVGSFQGAIDYLESRFGSDASILTSPDDIIKEAKKNGIIFTGLK